MPQGPGRVRHEALAGVTAVKVGPSDRVGAVIGPVDVRVVDGDVTAWGAPARDEVGAGVGAVPVTTWFVAGPRPSRAAARRERRSSTTPATSASGVSLRSCLIASPRSACPRASRESAAPTSVSLGSRLNGSRAARLALRAASDPPFCHRHRSTRHRFEPRGSRWPGKEPRAGSRTPCARVCLAQSPEPSPPPVARRQSRYRPAMLSARWPGSAAGHRCRRTRRSRVPCLRPSAPPRGAPSHG